LSKTAVYDAPGTNTLGILDIFGCERFDMNGLEQLCVNFTNERLHNSFLQEVFLNEGKLYESEGISLQDAGIVFVDNSATISMIAGTEGMFAELLNSENRDLFAVINASDDDMEIEKRLQPLAQGDGLTVGPGQFSVVHYFGKLRLHHYFVVGSVLLASHITEFWRR
jgi:myosin heavy subunit